MVKQINAKIPDEMHRALRVRLAENGELYSDWLRARITEYLKEKKPKGKRRKGKED
jgi:plasmid stability protein